jgi:hypothetical protein
MGGSPSSYKELHDCLSKDYIDTYINSFRSYPEDMLNQFSIISQKDSDRIKITAILDRMRDKQQFDPQLLGI